MAPDTRSRGAPASSRVYNSSPALQQVQFPARRKKVRRYEQTERPGLKQQTLTQIDFVSSFEEDDVVTLSDSDDDITGQAEGSDDKENVNPGGVGAQEDQEEQEQDDDQPVSRRRRRVAPLSQPSKKRRRTLGDDTVPVVKSRKQEDSSRRRTLGDVPPSSSYHTQTLTQFLGHQTSFVADSDDEVDLDKDDEDEGFLSWLGEPGEPGEPGSPSAGRGRRDVASPAMRKHHAAPREADMRAFREESVIPQTPTKRATTLRFDIPSGGLQSPSQRMLDRYEAPGGQDSPLKNRSSPMQPPPVVLAGEPPRDTAPTLSKQPSLVIQDSYPTEGWTTPSKSQARASSFSQKKTPTPIRHSLGTPSRLNPLGDEDGTPTKTRIPKPKAPSPKKGTLGTLYEIPDSDEDEDDDDEFGGEMDETEMSAKRDTAHETLYGAGVETQMIMSEIASADSYQDSCQDIVPCSTQTSKHLTPSQPAIPPATGQNDPPPSTRSRTETTPRPRQPSALPPAKPLRKPLHHPSGHTQTQSQPWESQRVPVSVLQSLPTPSARSDILLPISTISLEALTTGHTLHVTTPFKIPAQVVRFWLLEKDLLRYMASVEPGRQVQPAGNSSVSLSSSSSSQGEWQFHAVQLYELNNPVRRDDMREEGWIEGHISRYTYLPPAIISQLLWNLRHAVFADPSEQHAPSSPIKSSPPPPPPPPPPHRHPTTSKNNAPGPVIPSATPQSSMTVSQQITAQIHSDIASSTQFLPSDNIVPSTPETTTNPRVPSSSSSSSSTATALPSTSHAVRPSQATTASQPSTPEQQPHDPSDMPPPPPCNPSESSSVQFIELGSLDSLPFPSSLGSTSQLLTKSQMLPDSLIQDHAPPAQPEIWDSDEEDAPL